MSEPLEDHVPHVEYGCPIPTTHRRLDDAHRLWHQALDAYADPDGFRVALNSAVQTFRSVTLMLQTEKAAIPGFAAWYEPWQERMPADPVMKWLNDARVTVFHQGDLETHSYARFRVRDEWVAAPVLLEAEVDPFTPTEEIAVQAAQQLGEVEDELVLSVERRWVASDLPSHEVLEALAHCFGVLASVVGEAHELAGARIEQQRLEPDGPTRTWDAAHLGGLKPCMVVTEGARTTFIKPRTRQIVSVQRLTPPMRALSEYGEKAFDRYGLQAIFADFKLPEDPLDWVQHYAAIARRMLMVDRYHIHLAVLIGPNGKRFIQYTPEDREEKYLTWDNIAAEVRETGATTVISIGEAWHYFVPDTEIGRALIRPQRTEGLWVMGGTREGRYRSSRLPFTKRLGRIVPGRAEIVDFSEPPNFFKPVVAAWKTFTPAHTS